MGARRQVDRDRVDDGDRIGEIEKHAGALTWSRGDIPLHDSSLPGGREVIFRQMPDDWQAATSCNFPLQSGRGVTTAPRTFCCHSLQKRKSWTGRQPGTSPPS